MMKIGILTTYFSQNYGAALQAYALLTKLKQLGFDAELIAYQERHGSHYSPQKWLEAQRCLSIRNRIIRKLKNAVIKLQHCFSDEHNEAIRNAKFSDFISSYLTLSSKAFSSSQDFLETVPQMNYDAFICGSDQIWNPIVHNFDDVYFLNFPTHALKIAYAPSIAYNNFTETELQRLGKAIGSIDVLSVREISTVTQLQPYVNKKLHHVIDPTFLLKKAQWLQLKSSETFSGKYILVYLLGYNEQSKIIQKIISQYAINNNCRIICLPYTGICFTSPNVSVEYRYDIGPNDFIQLLNGAFCVFTNSFHATALAINLNISFFVVSARERNHGLQSRISDLLEITSLSEQKIFSDQNIIEKPVTIDYSTVNTVIASYRKDGIDFLCQALNGKPKQTS